MPAARAGVLLATLFMLLGPVTARAQAGTCVESQLCGRFQLSLGGTASGMSEEFSAVVGLPDGGYILAGRADAWGAEGDGLIVRLNPCGDILWVRTYGGPGLDQFLAVTQVPDGGFVVAGETQSVNLAGDAWVMKINAEGIMQWSQVIGGPDQDFAQSVSATSDGGFVVAAKTYSYGPNTPTWHNGLVFKLDTNGAVQWSRMFGANDGSMDVVQIREVRDVNGAWDGFLFVGGAEGFGAGKDDAWIGRLNPDGTHRWSKAYGRGSDDDAISFVQTPAGGFMVAGTTRRKADDGTHFEAVGRDVYLLELDINGALGSFRRFNGDAEKDDESVNIAATPSGAVIIGKTGSWGASDRDGFALHVASGGAVISGHVFGGTQDDYTTAVDVTAEGGFALAGRRASGALGGADAWFLRLGPDGASGCGDIAFSPTSVEYAPAYEEFTPVMQDVGDVVPFQVVQSTRSVDGFVNNLCPCQEWLDAGPTPECTAPSDCDDIFEDGVCQPDETGQWACEDGLCRWDCRRIVEPPDAGPGDVGNPKDGGSTSGSWDAGTPDDRGRHDGAGASSSGASSSSASSSSGGASSSSSSSSLGLTSSSSSAGGTSGTANTGTSNTSSSNGGVTGTSSSSSSTGGVEDGGDGMDVNQPPTHDAGSTSNSGGSGGGPGPGPNGPFGGCNCSTTDGTMGAAMFAILLVLRRRRPHRP
ncbi:MAG: MYXO-CTERM sorting domain-containing protein [Myxococcota bacterium]